MVLWNCVFIDEPGLIILHTNAPACRDPPNTSQQRANCTRERTGATAKVTSHEAHLLQGKVPGRFRVKKSTAL